MTGWMRSSARSRNAYRRWRGGAPPEESRAALATPGRAAQCPRFRAPAGRRPGPGRRRLGSIAWPRSRRPRPAPWRRSTTPALTAPPPATGRRSSAGSEPTKRRPPSSRGRRRPLPSWRPPVGRRPRPSQRRTRQPAAPRQRPPHTTLVTEHRAAALRGLLVVGERGLRPTRLGLPTTTSRPSWPKPRGPGTGERGGRGGRCRRA